VGKREEKEGRGNGCFVGRVGEVWGKERKGALPLSMLRDASLAKAAGTRR